VDGLDGSAAAKKRLRVILETVAGERTVEEACEQLGMGPAAFSKLRERTLADALQSLEPRNVGRPKRTPSPEQEKLEALQAELFEVKKDLQAARIREEIAVVMPHLLRDKKGKKKKEKGGRRQRP
jgi:hypothetical protein